MKRWEVWLYNAGVALVAGSGIVYGIMKYFLAGGDPDSRLGSPWQPDVLKIHILAAPILVFGLGLIFRAHAILRFRSGARNGRASGLWLFWIVSPMVLSGYLVQALTGDAARRCTGWLHAGLGALFVAAFVAHLFNQPDP